MILGWEKQLSGFGKKKICHERTVKSQLVNNREETAATTGKLEDKK